MLKRSTIILALTMVLAAQSIAQSTAFTFQGALQDNGAAANGQYDFEFRLFDQLNGGSQQGPVVAANAVSVTDGSFAVTLDFGEIPRGQQVDRDKSKTGGQSRGL